MTRTLILELPWPPSLNRAYRAAGGRVLLSEAGRGYARKVNNALPTGLVEPFRHAGLRVDVALHAPANYGTRKWDVMNREKILCDALTKCRVWGDDSQIDWFRIWRAAPDEGTGRAVVTIMER